jgi:hypothetical protein
MAQGQSRQKEPLQQALDAPQKSRRHHAQLREAQHEGLEQFIQGGARMSVYDEPLPQEFTAPVICRIKRKFTAYVKGKMQLCYELEPIVLPERDDDQSREASAPSVHAKVAERGK